MSDNIIVVTPYLTEGGVERVLSELMNEWVLAGKSVTLVLTHANLYKESYKIDPKIKIIKFNNYKSAWKQRINSVVSLINLMNKNKDATVLGLMNSSIFLIAFCALFTNNRIVFSERNDPNQDPPSAIRRRIRDICFKRADYCVFQTEDAKKHFSKKIQDKSTIIMNPINKEIPEPYVGMKEKKIIAVGRLSKQKNMELLVNAFYLFHQDYPSFSLDIYGRGELKDDLEEQIKRLGLNNCVHLKGFSTDIYTVMKKSYMYVSSSDREGISNTMLEAMALGLPTICTDCPIGGAREVIENNINGVLVPIKDIQSLYMAMKKVVEDKNFMQFISKNALNVRDKYKSSKIAQQWLEIL